MARLVRVIKILRGSPTINVSKVSQSTRTICSSMRRLCSPCESVPLSRSCPSTRLYGGKISTKFAPPDRSTLKTLGIQSLVRILYWPQPLISGVTQKNICWQASILGLYHSSFNPFIYHSQPNFRFTTQDYTACCQRDYCRTNLSLCLQISHN